MKRARWNRWLGTILALVLAASAQGQSVHVVAGDGSGDFTQLYAAVNVAADGDVILVRPHTERYDFTIINGKALTIVGDGAVRPRLKDIIVLNLPAGRNVTLRSLDLEGRAQVPSFPLPLQKPGVHAKDDEGCVWLQDLVVLGGSGIPYWGGYEIGWPGLWADGSDCIVVVDSTFTGGHGYWSIAGTAYAGGEGGVLDRSSVALHGSTFVGGEGGSGDVSYPGTGGIGLESSGSVVFASGSLVSGGDTGLLGAFAPVVPSATGLFARDLSTVEHLATTFAAGGGPAAPGTPLEIEAASTVEDLDDAHRALEVSAVVRELEAGLVSYSGEPGDLVLLRISSAPGWSFTLSLKGVQHLDAIAGELFLGAAGPAGTLDVVFRAPPLPPGMEALTAFAQPFVAEADGSLRLGAPSSVLIVDASIPLP